MVYLDFVETLNVAEVPGCTEAPGEISLTAEDGSNHAVSATGQVERLHKERSVTRTPPGDQRPLSERRANRKAR